MFIWLEISHREKVIALCHVAFYCLASSGPLYQNSKETNPIFLCTRNLYLRRRRETFYIDRSTPIHNNSVNVDPADLFALVFL